ncbi:MAG: MFS transporter [Elusimicrobiota bacterium]
MKKINKNILLLGMVSFLNDFSSEMIMPILPMFIRSLGGTEAVVGLVGGLRDSISSVLKLVFGWLSDRTGKRKVYVIFGYLSSAVFKLMLGFSKIWQQIVIFAGLERVGKGMRTAPRDAIISSSAKDKKGRGFGIHRAMDTAGAIIGALSAFLLFWFLGFNFKTIIIIAAVLSLLSLIPLHPVKEKKTLEKKETSLKVGLKSISKPLKAVIIITGLFALSNFSYMFFILKARDSFEGILSPKLAVGLPILLYVLFNIFYASFSIPFGNISDKIGRRKVLIIGYFLFSLTSLGFAFFNSVGAFIALFALYGIVYSIVDGNQRAYVSDISSEELRATALGTFHMIIGLAALPASLIAGYLWKFGSIYTFLYGSLFSAVAGILFLIYPIIVKQ